MSGRNIGASVRQRLLNSARAEGRPFQELLQYFAMERFLYRLAKSAFVDQFVLKGALLLTA
ncbi:MAG: nucleotidyl transferase AbiEii/AbiGii toxin family protein, partial [Acidobacteriota bacterium]